MVNRREFISTFTRSSFLLALIALSGFLIFKKGNGGKDACNLDFVCSNCKKVHACSLDEAVQYKKKNNQ